MQYLKSGAAYVPIDANYPNERQKFFLKNTNSIVLFCFDIKYLLMIFHDFIYFIILF